MADDVSDWEKAALRAELSAAYKRLEALGPDIFWAKHYTEGKAAGTILDIDFPVRAKSRDFSASPQMRGLLAKLEAERGAYVDLLAHIAAQYGEALREIPMDAPDDARQPHWMNGWLPGLDGAAIYAFVADRKPKTYFEVGSGNSTKFARRAIADHNLSTRIVSVDPMPRAEVDAICDEMHRCGFEDFDLARMDDLEAGDVVFIDNSHRSLPNSDVTVFFMEALGRIPVGCLYGIHDIFLPWDYPEDWAPRFYSEQYLLAAYLFGGADGDEIVLPGAFASRTDIIRALDPLWSAKPGILDHGGGFWMKKA